MKWSVKAGRAARSQTKSNTSSRGAEMMVETVTSRMSAPSYRPTRRGQTGGLGGAGHYGKPALARVHPLASHRAPAVLGEPREAELAEHTAPVQLVHALTGERRAAAVGAGRIRVGEGSDAAADEHGGE